MVRRHRRAAHVASPHKTPISGRIAPLPTSMASIAGKPLILLHGGIDPDSFGSNLAKLAKRRQVIAVHLQAHGRTPDTDRPLRCETMGDDVAALIGHLKLGKADVMGYSLGSFVALQTAIRHPDAVDRLVLMAARMRQDD